MQTDAVLIPYEGRHKIFTRIVRAANPDLVFILWHGAFVHSEYTFPIALALGEKGYSTLCPDLPSHGRSSGTKGHMTTIENSLIATLSLVETITNQGKEVVLGGESFGALIALEFANRYPEKMKGLLLSSPAFYLTATPSAKILNLLDRVAHWFGFFKPPLGVVFDGVTRRRDAAELLLADKAVIRRYSLKFYQLLFKQSVTTLSLLKSVNLPTLLLLGEQDGIIGVPQLLKDVQENPMIAHHVFPEFRHSVLSEDPQQVAQIIDHWVKDTLRIKI